MDDLLEAWRKNNAVNQRLLALCPEEAFELKPGKGKTIRSNFVHIVGVRRSHVEEKHRAAAEEIPKLDWKTASREAIAEALDRSYEATIPLFARLSERPTRWTAATFLAYSIAHEAHHRSQIEIALRLGGLEPPEMTLLDLWNWPRL